MTGGWLAARGRELGAALGLLTRLPLGRWPMPADAAGFARAAWAYPLVGALAGGVAGGAQALLVAFGLPPALAAPWSLAVLLLLTGALHEDGLADMADGFGGGRDRARKLAIMRDSRIGSFGALALLLSLFLRGAALALLPSPLLMMAAAGALSRAALLVPLGLLPPARADGLAAGLGRAGVAPGLAVGAALAFLLLPPGGAFSALLAAVLAGLGVALLARRQVGGHTGDVLGGCAVLAECAVLTALLLGR